MGSRVIPAPEEQGTLGEAGGTSDFVNVIGGLVSGLVHFVWCGMLLVGSYGTESLLSVMDNLCCVVRS